MGYTIFFPVGGGGQKCQNEALSNFSRVLSEILSFFGGVRFEDFFSFPWDVDLVSLVIAGNWSNP